MIRRGWAQHRRAFAGVFLVAVAAVAFGVAQALAGTGTATAPIEKNTFCGTDIGTKTIGSVKFTLDDKTTLREHVRLTKASPSTKYRVLLQNGGCTFGTLLGYLKTDSSGAGEATFTSSTFGYHSFFVNVFPDVCCGVSGESVTVKVGG